MIITEQIGEGFIKTYSSDEKNIKQVESGIIMQSAIDVYPCPYNYIETDENPPESEPDAAEILDILLGGESE